MMTTTEMQKKEAEDKAQRKQHFANFMDQPPTRMMLSMIPPAEDKREVLETLLQATFDCGYNAGSASVALDFIKVLLKADQAKRG